MNLSKYCAIYPTDDDSDSVILFSTKKASAMQIDKSLLTEIERGTLDDEEIRSLTDLGFLVNSREDEKEELLRYIAECNEVDTSLSLIVALNLDCNLACPYCFEGSRKGSLYMSRETADWLIEFIKGMSAGKETINITFYGGEPLLNRDILVYIAEGVKETADMSGVSFRFSLISNATLLTPTTVEKLIPLGLKAASITLDGPQETHDLSRPFKSGKGSFETIVQNIKEVCGLIGIDVGGNFGPDTYREFPKLLDYLIAEGIGPEKVSQVQFAPITTETTDIRSPEFGGGCRSVNEPWLFEASVFLREEIMRRGFQTGAITPMVCMIERQGSLLVNYDGSIYKCPGFLGRKYFAIGSVQSCIKDCESVYNLDNWKNEECLSCKYLPLCFGGCRYMKFVRDGNLNGVDCKKPYYEACLEELVKQDLRYLV
jgi:uncharacterized protein